MFLTILSVWRGVWPFYVLAGFTWMYFSFQYTDQKIGVILFLVGLVCLAGAKWDRR